VPYHYHVAFHQCSLFGFQGAVLAMYNDQLTINN